MRRSPYFISSLLLTACTAGTWTTDKWFDDPIGVLPNLLGFSLGALTIFLGFGSESFRNFLSGPSKTRSISPFVGATTTFVHFIFVQCISLLTALVMRACFSTHIPQVIENIIPWIYFLNDTIRSIAWAFGYWLFLYALVLAFSSALSMFQLAKLFDAWRAVEKEKEEALNEQKKAIDASMAAEALKKASRRKLPRRGDRLS